MNLESLPQVKPGDSVKADHHNSLVKAIRRRTPVSSQTVKIVETTSGFYCETIHSGSRASAQSHPFLAPSRASSSSVIQAGSVNGNLVTGSPVNIATEGTAQLYIRVTITLTISANGYVADNFASETAWIYQTGSIVPDNTSSFFYVPVATYSNGVKTVQHLTTNISLRPRDDGTGTSTPTAFYWRS